MTTLEKIEQKNNIEEQEFGKMSKLLFQSFIITKKYKSFTFLGKKEELINYFTEFLEKFLDLQLVTSKRDKLELINFIDKMNVQKELLELKKNQITPAEIQLAGKRLGKKSQSAFLNK